jgi:hypothetical protein
MSELVLGGVGLVLFVGLPIAGLIAMLCSKDF